MSEEMAETKKKGNITRWWLQLQFAFFSDKRVRALRRKCGDLALIIYQKMMLKSLENNCSMKYEGLEDTFEEEIAVDIVEDEAEKVFLIKNVMEFLICHDLMVEQEDGSYFFPQAATMSASETDSAERMRRKRERDKEKASQCDGFASLDTSICDDGTSQCEVIIKELELKNNKKDICTEPEESVSMPPVISLTLNDKSLHNIFQSDIDDWKGLYPAVDILQELRKMKGWLDSNPTKRKTQRGIMRFINGWLSREQDRSGTKGNTETFQGVSGSGRDISSLPVGTDISESGEEIETEIYRIVSRRIIPEAIERYTDKMHELIHLCCPEDDFSQKQIDYMRKEWGIEPVKKEDTLIPPCTDNFSYWDARLYEDDTN